MITIDQIITLAEESGIGVEKDSSQSGMFYEDQDGNIHEVDIEEVIQS